MTVRRRLRAPVDLERAVFGDLDHVAGQCHHTADELLPGLGAVYDHVVCRIRLLEPIRQRDIAIARCGRHAAAANDHKPEHRLQQDRSHADRANRLRRRGARTSSRLGALGASLDDARLRRLRYFPCEPFGLLRR